MSKKIFITRRIPESGVNLLKERYDVEMFSEDRAVEKDLLIRKAGECDALVCLLSDKIDRDILAAGKNLKIVANYAVGYNNIDIAAAKELGIMVTNTPGVLTNATAEIAFALLITLTRKIIEADRYTREGRFTGWGPLLYLGDELKGKTAGIIGMGRIGLDMAAKCKAFGMKIAYHNRKPLDADTEKDLEAEYHALDDLLKKADAISIHTPLTPETNHLIDRAAFEKMKDGVYLINTSRGEVVDEKALVGALQSGKVKGAGLDVYEFEPAIEGELTEMKNVVLLPHIGSGTIETRRKMSEMAAENVISALEGKQPENLVPEMRGD